MPSNDDDKILQLVRPMVRQVTHFRKGLNAVKILIEFQPAQALKIIDRWCELELIEPDERLALHQFFEVMA